MKYSLYLLCFLASVCVVAAYQKSSDAPDFLIVPGGRLVHKSCVHSVPSGTHIDRHKVTGHYTVYFPDGTVRYDTPCPIEAPSARHGVAWKAYAQYHNTSGFTYMSSNWLVPSEPSLYIGQILYFWPGTEPDDNSFVLQPVLQYGSTPAGGGKYWGIASWYVGSRTYVSDVAKVAVGTQVFGLMQRFNNGSWLISGESTVTGSPSVNITVNDIVTQTYAYCVLEAYSMYNCQEYPKNNTYVPFTNLVTQVQGVGSTPVWQALTQDPITCNEKATIVSPTEVHINFNNS